MCSLNPQLILRLLEILFSFLAFIVELSKLGIARPWGVWCEFVWAFCFLVPAIIIILEETKGNLLLAAFLPNWADLTCGLTLLCAVMIISASIVFAAIFTCTYCFYRIFCILSSLLATLVFLVDAFMQKKKGPDGFLSGKRGLLRMAQAFVACITITAASDYFIGVEKYARPFGMICCLIIFVVCLLVTLLLILLNLVTLLQALIPFGLRKLDLAFDILACVLYITAVILWAVFGYRRYRRLWYYWYYNRNCPNCSSADLNTVTAGSVLNLVLYLADLLLCIKDG